MLYTFQILAIIFKRRSYYVVSEELQEKWERLWHFFSISQQFGEWTIEGKDASEEESILVIKAKAILTKYGVMDNPKLLTNVFDSLSESEKTICVTALEVITKYMKYHPNLN